MTHLITDTPRIRDPEPSNSSKWPRSPIPPAAKSNGNTDTFAQEYTYSHVQQFGSVDEEWNCDVSGMDSKFFEAIDEAWKCYMSDIGGATTFDTYPGNASTTLAEPFDLGVSTMAAHDELDSEVHSAVVRQTYGYPYNSGETPHSVEGSWQTVVAQLWGMNT